jgi:hypothetical protein
MKAKLPKERKMRRVLAKDVFEKDSYKINIVTLAEIAPKPTDVNQRIIRRNAMLEIPPFPWLSGRDCNRS